MEKTKKLNMELPQEGRFISSEFPILRENLIIIDQAIADVDKQVKEKAPLQHTHEISDVTGLETELKGKMSADKTFSFADLADVEGAQDAANNYVLYKSSNNHFTFGSAKSLLGVHQHKMEDIVGLEASYQEMYDEMKQAIREVFPSGFIATFAMQQVPRGWLLCDGATYEREEYPQLFEAIGEQWGADSETTFKVPDFRGMFLRGLDSGRGLDPERDFATEQQDSIRSHTHDCTLETAGQHTHNFRYLYTTRGVGQIGGRNPAFGNFQDSANTQPAGAHTHKATISSTGEVETRPVNATVVYAIKS
ncbi:Bgr_08870 family protein [Bartonella sp. CB74]|uniref:Bgr_08870 family protein n=1 Tax=Bartonella sp. CB74 TaxID=3113620 RepID=UPI002F962AE0